jgi:hypothetical protein
MSRARNPDSRVGNNVDLALAMNEAMLWIGAQVDLVMAIRNFERLRQFPRPRTELSFVVNAAAPFHQVDSAQRFEGANQNKPVSFAFDERV